MSFPIKMFKNPIFWLLAFTLTAYADKELPIWKIEKLVRHMGGKNEEKRLEASKTFRETGEKGWRVMSAKIMKQPLKRRKRLVEYVKKNKKEDPAGKVLAKVAIYDKEEEHRNIAMASLKGSESQAAKKYLLSKAHSKHEGVRHRVARTIRRIGDTSYVPALMRSAYHSHRTQRVGGMVGMSISATFHGPVTFRKRTIRAQVDRNVNGVNVPAVVEMPIELPSVQKVDIQTHIMVPAIMTLQQLTGKDFGEDFSSWGNWWGTAASTFSF